ncbi:unnamed protein product [Strongylus vulgaris]|uniref:Uncharacterized protein n=1 Tax=Strongylus vulgaris TaxID=40348 RepID=A0A3P7IIL2_STRVU|nr:unnamed protein product [Strongylus vulgaris]
MSIEKGVVVDEDRGVTVAAAYMYTAQVRGIPRAGIMRKESVTSLRADYYMGRKSGREWCLPRIARNPCGKSFVFMTLSCCSQNVHDYGRGGHLFTVNWGTSLRAGFHR